MAQPSTDALLAEFDRFIGEWTMQATPPGGPPWPGEGHVRFEWLEDRTFLVQRWSIDLPDAPDGVPTSGTSIFGCDTAHGTYFQLYYDNRGVHRVYSMDVKGGTWKLWRDGPPFGQRFSATFAADGRAINGRWEIAEDGQEWRTDFDVVYSRVG